ncbi:MAG: 2-oxoacid:ferredoxin oxidoreductase subunit gamma [Desulfobacteraceae bacterium]|nr:2-oxoacid:ferredoxin oxidoreductase subunit gamma [Desulfobacteraceae bacterium]
MQTEIKFAGFGGQGILLSAKLLAYAAMKQGSFVAWVPSYGPEMRGGTAYCTVVISDKLIGSPIIKNPTHLVAMNRPSLETFVDDVKPGGIVFINSSLIPVRSNREDIIELVVPINEIAADAGSVRAANIVALAAFNAKAKLVDPELLKQCVKDEFAAKAKIIPLNMKAFDEGMNFVENN